MDYGNQKGPWNRLYFSRPGMLSLSRPRRSREVAPRAGFEPASRSNERVFECRTGDSRTYSRPAPASRGPGYTNSTHPGMDWARARQLSPGQPECGKDAKIKLSRSLDGEKHARLLPPPRQG